MTAAILLCLVFCAAWFLLYTAANTNGVFFAVTSVTYAAALVFGIVRLGFRESFFYLPVSVWNHILNRLDSLGFMALSGLHVNAPGCDPLTAGGALYIKLGFYAFCAFASFVFVSCIYKKVRAVPVIITAGIIMTLTFTYNLLTDNFGFVLTLASGIGILVLIYFSSFTKDRPQSDVKNGQKNSFRERRQSIARAAAPGIAAFTAVAVVLAVAAYPAIRINESAPKISVLDDFIDQARQIFSGYLAGDFAGDEIYDSPKKSTNPTPRNFKNKELLTVTAQYPTAKYLRAWIAESYSSNKWMSASGSNSGVQILPEEITELFYTVVDIDANVVSDPDKADTGYLNRGFTKEHVTVKSTALAGDAGLLASRYSTLYGISGNIKGNGYKLREGVGTIGLSMKGSEYTAVSYSPNYQKLSLSKLDNDMKIYNIVLPYIEEYIHRRLQEDEFADELLSIIKENIREEADRQSVEIPSGCLINYVADMSDADLYELSQKITQVREYENYVYDNCLSIPWSEENVIKNASINSFGDTKFVSRGEQPSAVYELALMTARYLAETCSYDLSPEGYTERGSYVSQFLTSVKSGYCVQYATAGALMLRSAGIPTRYVDGYIASDFRAKNDKYVCGVLDSNAHAWIEVYVSGYGWMTFEMTEPMLDGIYGTPGQSGNGEMSDMTDTETETADISQITQETETTSTETNTWDPLTEPEDTYVHDPYVTNPTFGSTVVTVCIIILSVLTVSTLIYFYLKLTSGKAKKRKRMLEKAARGESTDPENDIKEISSYIFFLFERRNVIRGKTELMSDFAKRADSLIYCRLSFVSAAHAIQKNSFGRCADANDCKTAADYALQLQLSTKDKLSLPQQIWYCKVLKLI